MSIFRLADDFWFDWVFQPFSNWFCNLTGLTSFAITRALMVFICVLMATPAVFLAIVGVYNGLFVLVLIGAGTLIPLFAMREMLLFYFMEMRKFERKLGSGESIGMNPLRANKHELLIRLTATGFACFVNPPLLAESLSTAGVLSFPLAVIFLACTLLMPTAYFAACTPEPRKRKPKKAKARAAAPLHALPQGA